MRTVSSSSSLLVLLVAAALAALIAPAILGLGQATDENDWEKVAGGKQEFDAASIKPSPPDAQPHANFGLSIDNETLPPGGLLSASNRPLASYIMFAYKINLTREQQAAMVAHLPKWVAEQGFDFNARVEGCPTKDQTRLMMQSLLADRFKLKIHFETRTVPVLAMVLVKPGVLGPRLRPHAEDLPCDAKWTPPKDFFSSSLTPDEFQPLCGTVSMRPGPHYTFLVGARNVTMAVIAQYLPQDFGRPVVDETGLSGPFDFLLYSTPDSIDASAPNPGSPAPGASLDSGAPTFTEALKEQFGIKLESTTAPVRILVIDHVEHPSPN